MAIFLLKERPGFWAAMQSKPFKRFQKSNLKYATAQTTKYSNEVFKARNVAAKINDFLGRKVISLQAYAGEGFHTKMEMISRRAYGFRNFKNYRLRVIALCGWDGVFAIRS